MLFSAKIPFHVAARLTVRFWVPHLLRFATIRHYSRLFAIIRTMRDYSHYSYYSLFGTIRDYSLFGFSRHPSTTLGDLGAASQDDAIFSGESFWVSAGGDGLLEAVV